MSSTSAFYNEDPLSPANEAKKARVVLSDEQKHILRSAYEDESYPSTDTVNTLARQLGLSVRTVVNWFHNRRMRSKPPPGGAAGGASEEIDDGLSDDGLDASTFGGDAPDQYFSYEDELAFAHAELERLATEEDGVGLGESADTHSSMLNTDDSAGDWTANTTAMDNLGWTGDEEELTEDGVENDYALKHEEEEEDYDRLVVSEPKAVSSKKGSTSTDNGEPAAATVAKPRLSLLERLEQYVKREDPSWEDENGRTEAIARLERSLNHEENTEWEF